MNWPVLWAIRRRGFPVAFVLLHFNEEYLPMAALRAYRTLGPLAACALWLACTASVQADLKVTQVSPAVYYGNSPRSESDYHQLQALGIRTVIDLRKFTPRASAREEAQVSAHGMTYRLIAMGFRPTRDWTPEEVLQVLADPDAQPVYLHCMLGRDRAGLVVALYRVRFLGWDRESAYAVMQQERFNPLLRDLDRYFWLYAR